MILGGKDNTYCSVLFYDEVSCRVLPVVITKEEAEAMLVAMKGIDFPRPMTFHLITEIIRSNGLVPEGAYITEISNGIFISTLKLQRKGQIREYDARPSDAITIALMFGCPIFISQKILDGAGFPIPERYKTMTPQERGIEYLSTQVEKTLTEMTDKISTLKSKKSLSDIQTQIDRLLNYVFEKSAL